MADVLFAVRNNYYLGAYQAAVNEAQDIDSLSDLDQVERDVFIHRSYIALGSQKLVISQIPDTAAQALLAVKLYAQYSSGALPKDVVLETVSGWLADPSVNQNPTVCLMAGIIYAAEGSYVEALKACGGGSTLDTHALCTQVYLKMDRPDQAEKSVKAMSDIADDGTLTQLAQAWLGLALGGAKAQEAAFIYQELGDKYTWSTMLHNGLGAANMKMGRWEEAERDLQDALKIDANNADTLANLVSCSLHQGKNHARFLTQLQIAAPDHFMVARQKAAEEAFDRAAVAAA